MLNAFLQLDSQATQFINALIPHNQFFDSFFSFFSLRGNSIFIWLSVALLLIFFEEKIHKKFILYLLFALCISSLLVFGLKNIVQRSRPIQTDSNPSTSLRVNRLQLIQPISTICPTDFSFPSGHAATAFAAATVLAVFDKKRGWFYFFVAVLIGISRIYLGCHYFFDVLTGGLIGYLISAACLRLKKLF